MERGSECSSDLLSAVYVTTATICVRNTYYVLCPLSIVLPILPHRLLLHPWSVSSMAPFCRWGNGGSLSCSVTISPHLQDTSARNPSLAQPCMLTGSVTPIGQASSAWLVTSPATLPLYHHSWGKALLVQGPLHSVESHVIMAPQAGRTNCYNGILPEDAC